MFTLQTDIVSNEVYICTYEKMNNSFEEQYELHIKLFCKDLQRHLEKALLREMIPVVITPSRKMARLFIWLKKRGYLSIPNKTIIMSEYAITFSMNELIRLHGEKLSVVITDDFINSGKTSDNIAAYIKAYTKQTPTVIPLLVSENKIVLKYATLVYNGKRADRRLSEYFIKRNIENFMSMGMPVDMEYPVFNIKFPVGNIKGQNLEEKLCESFNGCTVYPIQHQFINNKDIANIIYYTVLLDQNKGKQYTDSDFSKIRFFFSDDNLTIEVYSPKTIEEYILREQKHFRNESLRRIWKFAMEKVEISNDLFDTEQMEIVSYSKMKSKIVFTNYLYSLVAFKQNLNSLFYFLDSIGANKNSVCIDLYTLGLLISPKKAQDLHPELQNLLFSDFIIESELNNILYPLEDEIVPEAYQNTYFQNNFVRLLHCQNVEEGISTIFNVQRLLSNNITSFGESFSSLENKLIISVPFENLNREVHQCVDFMIDEAAIAPSYMRIKKDQHYFWKRMFCSGDGQHVLDRFSKCALYIFDKYMDLTGKTIIEKEEFSSLLAMVFTNKVNIPFLTDMVGKNCLTHNISYTELYIENINKVNVLDFLNSQELLKVVDFNGMECYQGVSAEKSKKIREEVPLDEEQLWLTDNLVYFLWKYSGQKIQTIRAAVMPFPYDNLKEALGTYLSDLITLFKTTKNKKGLLSDMAKEMYLKMNDLFDFIQSYNLYITKDMPSFDNDDNDTVHFIWKKIFDTEEYGSVESPLLEELKKGTILFCEILILVNLFWFNEIKEAKDIFDSIKELNEENIVDLGDFSTMIDNKQYNENNLDKIIDTCISLTQQLY